MTLHRLTVSAEPAAEGTIHPAPGAWPARSRRPRLVLFGAAALLPWLLLSLVLRRFDLPDYGAWTGIRPLEQKLRMLEAFAQAGEVDAVVLGSSVSDFGFSAERLSQRVSAARGRPYRVFNFSTGAAEMADYPELYRLLRTVARPRSIVMIACAAGGPRSDQPRTEIPQTPVYYLAGAPVGSVLTSPRMLRASRRLWDLPPVRHAAALRDLLVFGSLHSPKGLGSDLYALNEHGDRVSYLYESSAETLAQYRDHLRDPGTASPPDPGGSDPYLAREDVEGLREMARLTDGDGCERIVVGHDKATHLVEGAALSPEHLAYRRKYVEHAAALAAAPTCLFLDELALPRHAVADYIHLNDHGAAAFTDRAASCWTRQAPEPPPTYREPDLARRDPPATFNSFAFALRRDAPAETTLRLRFVRSIAVPALSEESLFVALRQPDDTDLIASARREGEDIAVDFEELPRLPRTVFLGRLLTRSGDQYLVLNQPLASYRWEPSPARGTP